MVERWHTIKVRVSDDDWLHWRLALLAKGKTADLVVGRYVKQYVTRSNPVLKSKQAHSRTRSTPASKAGHQRGHK